MHSHSSSEAKQSRRLWNSAERTAGMTQYWPVVLALVWQQSPCHLGFIESTTLEGIIH
jgi:hypothetical protein